MELPKEYESWLSLYLRLRESIGFSDEVKDIRLYSPSITRDSNFTQYYKTYKLSYIKSKALDEVIEYIPSKQDLFWSIQELEYSDDVSRKTIETFKKLMQICPGSN